MMPLMLFILGAVFIQILVAIVGLVVLFPEKGIDSPKDTNKENVRYIRVVDKEHDYDEDY